jgi:hypothetical protein
MAWRCRQEKQQQQQQHRCWQQYMPRQQLQLPCGTMFALSTLWWFRVLHITASAALLVVGSFWNSRLLLHTCSHGTVFGWHTVWTVVGEYCAMSCYHPLCTPPLALYVTLPRIDSCDMAAAGVSVQVERQMLRYQLLQLCQPSLYLALLLFCSTQVRSWHRGRGWWPAAAL